MAERPALYRIFRLGDAVTLGLVALALTTTASATAARTEVAQRSRPLRRGQGACLPTSGSERGAAGWAAKRLPLPGQDPAIGGPYAAVISGGNEIRILNRSTRHQVGVGRRPGR